MIRRNPIPGVKSFTLIEVIIAIGILAISLASLFQIIASSRARIAKAEESWHNMHMLTQAAESAENAIGTARGAVKTANRAEQKADNAVETATDAAVDAAVDKFVGEAPQFDDLTMLCIEYKGETEE